jgi:RHS repeat-associated protein
VRYGYGRGEHPLREGLPDRWRHRRDNQCSTYETLRRLTSARTPSSALAVVHNTKYTLTRNFADPFGGRRGEVLDTPGDRGFLGKVEDTTGLTSVGARYYDSGVGRFVSVDPVMDMGDPQQWSAYTYANNNPVTWSDPTGLLSWKGAWSKVKNSAAGKWVSKNKAEIIGGVVGTVVGVGCAALTVGWGSVACAVAGGALASAITNTIRQSSSGEPFSWGSFATETVIGGVLGAVGQGKGAAASRWIAPMANRAVQGAVSAVRASTSRGGQAVASSARGTVSQARNSAARVAGTKPIPANKPKPPTAPSGTSNARPTGGGTKPSGASGAGCGAGNCGIPGAACFVAGTLILTEEGLKPIDAIERGLVAVTALDDAALNA